MSNIQKIQHAFQLVKQMPLDTRLWVAREEQLKDLGLNNEKAFLYYSGMLVVAADTGKMYIWKEWHEGKEHGLIPGGFTYPPNAISMGVDYSNKKYNFIEYPFGVDFKLEGDSTVFDDIYTNIIHVAYYNGLDTTAVNESEVLIERPFWIEKKEGGETYIWTKVSVDPLATKDIDVYIDASKTGNAEDVFEYFIDFEDGLGDWQKSGNKSWRTTTNNPYHGSRCATNRDIDNNKRAGMYKVFAFGFPYVIDFYWRASSETNFDYLNLKIDNLTVDRISGNTQWQNKVHFVGAGEHKVEFLFTKDSSVSSYDDAGYVDLFRVRKYAQTEPTISVSLIEAGHYKLSVHNPNSIPLENYQIYFSLPEDVTGVRIKETVKRPSLYLPYFSGTTNNTLSFIVQVPHKVKIGSNLRFHIHVLPLENITENKTVDFTLKFASVAIDEEPQMFEIRKQFIITPDMVNKHNILNWGEVIPVRTISQIMICELVRNATEDSYGDLPVMYADFHYELDTMGSQSEFIKY